MAYEELYNKLFQNSIGFDPFEHIINRSIPNFPKYNIIKEDENIYVLELALAGYNKHDIKIETADDKLFIGSDKRMDIDNKQELYLHKGISNKSFQVSYALGNNMKVTEASFNDGILSIILERIIPEEKKSKFIEII